MAWKLNNVNGILIAFAKGKVKQNYENLIEYLKLLSDVVSVAIIATAGCKSLLKTRKIASSYDHPFFTSSQIGGGVRWNFYQLIW